MKTSTEIKPPIDTHIKPINVHIHLDLLFEFINF